MSQIGFRVPPLGENEIERKAQQFRDMTGFINPATKIIAIVEHILPVVMGDKFNWLILEDGALGPDLARVTPDKLKIEITESIYDLAWEGDALANHILAHELGHLFMHENVDPPSYSFAGMQPPYNNVFNSEWQADRFADFFRMPRYDVMATCQSTEDIVNRYNVPKEAAQRRYVELFGPEQLMFKF